MLAVGEVASRRCTGGSDARVATVGTQRRSSFPRYGGTGSPPPPTLSTHPLHCTSPPSIYPLQTGGSIDQPGWGWGHCGNGPRNSFTRDKLSKNATTRGGGGSTVTRAANQRSGPAHRATNHRPPSHGGPVPPRGLCHQLPLPLN